MPPLHILVACEASGTVLRELRKIGHLAWSCDLQPTYGTQPEFHLIGDVREHLHLAPDSIPWDMLIGFPPCQYLSVVQTRWLTHPDDKHMPFAKRRCHPKHPGRRKKQKEAIAFFKCLFECGIPKIALENPRRSYLASMYRSPDFTFHPYMYGEPVQKLTGIWLKNLPVLEQGEWVRPEMIYTKRKNGAISRHAVSKWYAESARLPAAERTRVRSKTFPRVAQAMAEQWAGPVAVASCVK